VPISIDDAAGVAGADITLTFDASILTATGAQITALTGGFSLISSPTTGQIVISMARATGIASGNGSFVEVLFDVSASATGGDTSPLHLQSVLLYDETANPIADCAEHGTFIVSGCMSPPWSDPTPTPESVDFYGYFEIEEIDAEAGDAVGIFDPDGVICGKFIVSTPGQYGLLHVYRDDTTTPGIDEGAQPGDVLTFRIWDCSAEIELGAQLTVQTGFDPPTWTANGDIWHVDIEGALQEGIPLHAGWNLISFRIFNCYYDTASPPAATMIDGIDYVSVANIGDVLSSISGKYTVVRSFDSDGAHTYDPSLPPTFSDLHYMACGYGYWIKMTQPGLLELSGAKADAGVTRPLDIGWNLTGYWNPYCNCVETCGAGCPPLVDMPSDVPDCTAVADVGDVWISIDGLYSLIRGFDIYGAHTYDPSLPPSFSDLCYAAPGYGYWIKMMESGNLHF